MQFTGTHTVTTDDVAHAARLATRPRDTALSIVVIVVLLAVLAQVGYGFALYVGAVVKEPEKLLELMRFDKAGIGTGLVSWLSVLVTLLLPVFLFYAVRLLVDTMRPAASPPPHKGIRHNRPNDLRH